MLRTKDTLRRLHCAIIQQTENQIIILKKRVLSEMRLKVERLGKKPERKWNDELRLYLEEDIPPEGTILMTTDNNDGVVPFEGESDFSFDTSNMATLLCFLFYLSFMLLVYFYPNIIYDEIIPVAIANMTTESEDVNLTDTMTVDMNSNTDIDNGVHKSTESFM